MESTNEIQGRAIITKSTPEAKFVLNGMDEDTMQTIDSLEAYLIKVIYFNDMMFN